VDRHFEQLKAVKIMGNSLLSATTQILSTADEAKKLKHSSHKYIISFKETDSDVRNYAYEHSKSKPKLGFTQPNNSDKDDKDEHTKSKPEFVLRQSLFGDVDDNIQHLKQSLKLYFKKLKIIEKEDQGIQLHSLKLTSRTDNQ
jgi:hypothetical protein